MSVKSCTILVVVNHLSRPIVVLDGLLGLYGFKYDSVTACGLPLYLCSYKFDGFAIVTHPLHLFHEQQRTQSHDPMCDRMSVAAVAGPEVKVNHSLLCRPAPARPTHVCHPLHPCLLTRLEGI